MLNFWSLLNLFVYVKFKIEIIKKHEVKGGHNMYDYNQFIASQNLFYNFKNEFAMWLLLYDSVYLRLISKNFCLILENQNLQCTSLYKFLNRKMNIHFQNQIFNGKTRFKKFLFTWNSRGSLPLLQFITTCDNGGDSGVFNWGLFFFQVFFHSLY